MMSLSARVVLTILLHTFIWSLLNTSSNASVGDIYCLKSIKDSLEDPFNYLNSSWDFNNHTEGFICNFIGVDCWHHEEDKVLTLDLSGLGLKGHFPRGLANCSSLQGLNLSSNHLSGSIPSDIAKSIPYVTSLDLSKNRFSGEIPPSLVNCTYLNVLKLNDNKLTGQIPPTLAQLNRIKIFTVANNFLSGPVPKFGNSSVTARSYANNEGLCGEPLKACMYIGQQQQQRKKFDDDPFKRGFVFGWVFSAVSVVTVFMLYCIPKSQKKKNKMELKMPMTMMLMMRRKNKRKGAYTLLEGGKEISILEKLATRISFPELITATNNFSEENIIGLGKMGTMYKAVLTNGLLLAVNRFRDFQLFEKQFISEVKTMGRLRHSNLVPLFGFCVDRKERLLVYKYMVNGNLYDWLHPPEAKPKFLDWPLRVRIGIGLARGLAWLHHSCKFQITHGNISSKCVLLDQNFEPKISNFGGAVILKSNNDSNSSRGVSAKSKFGKSGYVNSEYESLLNPIKNDVYSFGIVLLEMVTGEKPNQVSNDSESFSGTLVEWITHLWDASRLHNAIDKLLIGRGFDDEIFQFIKAACNCVKTSPSERPAMLEVYEILSAIGGRYGIADDSEILTQSECEITN